MLCTTTKTLLLAPVYADEEIQESTANKLQ